MSSVQNTPADSGYILKPQALKLLMQGDYEGIYNDTIDFRSYAELKDTDTIGKYYRMHNGNLFACINDIIHSKSGAGQLLAEMSADGNMLRSEYYSNGMYLCCWDRWYDGFNKIGPYYVLDQCGTGSGHCSTNSLFMKGIGEDGGSSITRYVFTSMCTGGRSGMLACNMTSKSEFKGDTIVMHYTIEHLKPKRNNGFRVKSTRKFDIKYVQREERWVALDSTEINQFPL